MLGDCAERVRKSRIGNECRRSNAAQYRAYVEKRRSERGDAEAVARVKYAHGFRRKRDEQDKGHHYARQPNRERELLRLGCEAMREYADYRLRENDAEYYKKSKYQY